MVKTWPRILALAVKPDDEEYMLLLRLTLLGLALVGMIGVVIHMLFAVIMLR
ncbi:MAG: protein translocase SEC61 complex subunit gamma [Acidilobaceae archaeon]